MISKRPKAKVQTCEALGALVVCGDAEFSPLPAPSMRLPREATWGEKCMCEHRLAQGILNMILLWSGRWKLTGTRDVVALRLCRLDGRASHREWAMYVSTKDPRARIYPWFGALGPRNRPSRIDGR